MEKYEKHGLTRTQDGILGAFGMDDDLSKPIALGELEPRGTNADTRTAAVELVLKGLLKADTREDGTIEYSLTRSGKVLWKIRAAEEEEGPLH